MCVNFATVSKLMDVFFFVHFFFIGWWYTHSLFADCMVGLFFIWYSRGAIYCLLLSSSFYLSLRLLLLSLTHTALTFSLSSVLPLSLSFDPFLSFGSLCRLFFISLSHSRPLFHSFSRASYPLYAIRTLIFRNRLTHFPRWSRDRVSQCSAIMYTRFKYYCLFCLPKCFHNSFAHDFIAWVAVWFMWFFFISSYSCLFLLFLPFPKSSLTFDYNNNSFLLP